MDFCFFFKNQPRSQVLSPTRPNGIPAEREREKLISFAVVFGLLGFGYEFFPFPLTV